MTLQITLDGPADAPVLVLANSLAATQAMWDAQTAALHGAWRLLRFDYAGHADAPFPGDAPSTIDGIADMLMAQIDAAGIGRFSFLGLSLGGMLGLHVAARWPARVEHLIVANCRYYQTDTLRQQWDERIQAVTQRGMDAIADPTLERWLTPAFRQAHPDVAQDIHTMICSTSPAGYAAAASAVRDFDARPTLGAVRCPCLVISGAQDLAAPSAHLGELAQILNAPHIDLDPCAHLSCVEQAASFSQASKKFLA